MMRTVTRLGLAGLVLTTLPALGGERLPTPGQLEADRAKNRRSPAAYDPALSTWKARAIGVQGEPDPVVEDYATLRYGRPWDFSGETPRLPEGRLRLSGLEVTGGVLRYETMADAELFWGNHYGDKPEFGDEAIGAAWTGHWHPIRMRLRVRQSRPESDWVASMCQGQDAWMWRQKREFKLKGTGWQTVDIPVMDSRFCFRSFSLLTRQAGNAVEIDEVRLYTPRATRQYRYAFDLAAEPVRAALCVNASPIFDLSINGRTVAREEGDKDMGSLLYRYVELGRFFRKGPNVIQVEAEFYDWSGEKRSLILEGVARDASGRICPFYTDGSWQGRFRPVGSEDAPGPWKPVWVVGPVAIDDKFFIEPPYYGRIELSHPGRKCPIFGVDGPVAYPLRLYAPDLEGGFDLAVQVLDSLDGRKVVHEGVLARDLEPGVHEASFTWRAPGPGVYDVRFALRDGADGHTLDERVIETAVVGPIPQAEVDGKDFADGLDLRLVEDINCASDDDAHPFMSRSASGDELESTIVHAPFGRYRLAGKDYFSYLSWRIEVENPAKPHLMEIDYPDDDTRLINVSVGANCEVLGGIPCDSGDRQWNKVGSGVYTGFEQPNSNTMKTLRFIYWPGEPIGSVVVASSHSVPAAVARIRVCEIAAGLPALRCPSPRYRQTGCHTERLSLLPSTYFAGEEGAVFAEKFRLWPHRGFYKGWYETSANLVRRLRFLGENILVVGVHMYNRAEYPSPSYPGGFAAQADPLELMARMFARNGLGIYMGVEYGSPPELAQSGFNVTDAQVAAGTATFRQVDRNGRQAPNSFCGTLNIFAPEVEAGLDRIVKELCDLYEDTPGILGIHMQVGESLNPAVWGDHRLLDGYPEGMAVDDVTVSQFERDTGTEVPADGTGASRFAQRHDWITANARGKWIDWRCRRIHKINRKALDRLREANPGWRLSIGLQTRTVPVGPRGSFLESVRLQGYDPGLYGDPGFMLQFGANPVRVRAQLDDAGLWQLGRRFNRDPEVLAAFAPPGRAFSRWVGGGFFEPSLRGPREGWYWDNQLLIAYALPVGRNVLEGYNGTILDAVPEALFQHWLDVNGIGGSEQVLRRFNRAFTSLPPGDYRTLTGNGLDRNLVVRACERAFYVLNPLPVPVTATLEFRGRGRVVDLSTGRTLEPGRGMELALDAYGFESFGLEGRIRVTGVVGDAVPPELVARCRDAYESLRPVADALRPRVLSGDAFGGHAGEMKRFVEQVEAAGRSLDGGGVGQAWLILEGGELLSLLGVARDLASPQYWSVIGPFESRERAGFSSVLPVEGDVLGGGGIKKSYACALPEPARWRDVIASSQGESRGFIDFCALYGQQNDNRLAYGVARVRSARDFEGELWLGSDDSLAVWVNGEEVFRLATGRSASPASDKAPVRFRQGENTILFKLDNGVGGWAVFFDIRDAAGRKPAGVEFLSPGARAAD